LVFVRLPDRIGSVVAVAGGICLCVVAGGISAGVLWLVESAGVSGLVVFVDGGGPREDTLGVWVDCFFGGG